MQWEYTILARTYLDECSRYDEHPDMRPVSEAALNALGRDGWELVSCCFDADGDITRAVMKRRKDGTC